MSFRHKQILWDFNRVNVIFVVVYQTRECLSYWSICCLLQITRMKQSSICCTTWLNTSNGNRFYSILQTEFYNYQQNCHGFELYSPCKLVAMLKWKCTKLEKKLFGIEDRPTIFILTVNVGAKTKWLSISNYSYASSIMLEHVLGVRYETVIVERGGGFTNFWRYLRSSEIHKLFTSWKRVENMWPRCPIVKFMMQFSILYRTSYRPNCLIIS